MKEKKPPAATTREAHTDTRFPNGAVQRAVDGSTRMAAQSARLAQLVDAPQLLQLAPDVGVPMPSPSARMGGSHQALPPALRESMEAAFGHDFSKVRVQLSDIPTEIGARALTRGDDITMPARHYQPGSESGRRLIGHELGHVVQQRMGRVRQGAGILDDHSLEADADRQSARAIQAVGSHGPSVSARYTSAGSLGTAMPFQPAWEYVENAGKLRHCNLKDNRDGTFTHSATGIVYHDAGATDSSVPGSRVLSPKAKSVAPTALTHDPKNILFNIQQTGKLEYLANTQANRVAFAGKYYEMEPDMFSVFKSAGKRGASTKIMDPTTLEKYSYDDVAKQFFTWDKSKDNRRGAKISATAPSGGASPNAALIDKLNKGELLDRRRDDRSSEDLSPFDVGPYKSNVTMDSDSMTGVERTYPKLSGISAWTTSCQDVNRDHLPSGESLKQRGDGQAYNQGFTIAIPNPEMHQPHSPTFGTDNSHNNGIDDVMGGTSMKRVKTDANYPALAAYRDMDFMLTQTKGQDYSVSGQHSYLDLTKPVNRLRQIGSYRNLHHRNTQIFKRKGAKRGFDPGVPGYVYSAQARVAKKGKKIKTKRLGAYHYTKAPKKTQGALAVEAMIGHMQATGKLTGI
ncbi:DUF4157 domain-containing protein [Ralstonia flaminis]|jgi:hypothetical protein|uniref:eCIS core domain-containing protein n=1 Tax=Ralstonia flaminis TaxID=3058597 RepID=A0ABN9JNX8_9RALS|nr:DUF4157 domain-containing protein [Ralstonia sp. LMG 18101]CAJ0819092.1 hypothetical protein LMG18101_03831 [Ralstonia sp. LMG 18101]